MFDDNENLAHRYGITSPVLIVGAFIFVLIVVVTFLHFRQEQLTQKVSDMALWIERNGKVIERLEAESLRLQTGLNRIEVKLDMVISDAIAQSQQQRLKGKK